MLQTTNNAAKERKVRKYVDDQREKRRNMQSIGKSGWFRAAWNVALCQETMPFVTI